MHNQGMHLAWITVSDFKKAIDFYTKILGMKLSTKSEEYEWAELEGEGGAKVGLCTESEHSPIKAGENAVMTFTVQNLETTKKSLENKGISLIGDIMTVPGEVKLQLFQDPDGNYGQLVELLGKCCKKSSCCQ